METKLAGRYQIVRHLGGGGFGQTFLANDIHLPGHPLCVVKQLKPRINDPIHLQTAERLFNQEAETLYQLGSHEQIPRLLAHFEQEHEFYLVQEYIQGQSLNQEIIRGKRLSETYTISLLQDILQVLAFVHQQHVIHRDIKPSNLIRRSSDCRIVLIDFGAVKQVRSQTLSASGSTSVTVAIGSPGYMPSEQQAAKPHFSSDIYAVGMVGLEAMTGLRPKDFPRDAETAEFSCNLVKDLISISHEFAEFLDRMVRYDYRQRFANASVALQALQQLLGKDIPGANFQSHPMPPADTAFLPTVPPGSVAPTPQPVTPGVSGPTGSTQLSNSLKKSLEQLLSGVIGPISSVILKRAMEQSANGQALIDQLALQLPERERSRFREEAHKLLQKYGEPSTDSTRGQPIGTTAVPSQEPIPGLEPTFIKQCEQELAQYIGPIAPLMVQRTLSQHSQLSPTQLIDLLVQHVPNPNHREAFRRKLLAST